MLQMSPDQPSVVNSNSSRAPSHDPLSDKEAIRKEIRKMRHTRDSLVQQRQEIDERQHRVSIDLQDKSIFLFFTMKRVHFSIKIRV